MPAILRRISRALEVLDRRADRHVAWSITLGTAVAFLVAFIVTIARLRVHGPSLVDDWTMIRYGPGAWDQLKHFAYDPTIYDPGRFRPAFWGIWSQVEWHTLGAPGSMAGPNFWNYLKILVFCVSVAGIVVAALELSGARLGTGWTALLAALPTVLLLATPQFGVDFERLGPQEPLLFGGIALGVLLLLYAARALVDGRASNTRIAVAAVSGAVLYVFGVYVKEASVCLLAVLPFLPYGRLRASVRGLSGGRRIGLGVIAAVVILPLLHMAVEIVKLLQKPHLVYGVEKPHGVGGTISRIVNVAGDQWRGIGNLTGTPLWQVLIPAITVLVAVRAFRARSLRRLDVALVVLAWALFIFQGLTAAIETRYFIPVVALLGIAGVLWLAEQSRRVQYGMLVVVALVVLVHVRSVGNATFGYANNDRDSLRYIDSVAQLHPDACPVYRSRMDIEARFAVPEVLALRRVPGSGCVKGYDAVLVQGTDFLAETFDHKTDAAVEHACAAGWKQLEQIARARVLGCRHLSSAPPPASRLRPERSPVADL